MKKVQKFWALLSYHCNCFRKINVGNGKKESRAETTRVTKGKQNFFCCFANNLRCYLEASEEISAFFVHSGNIVVFREPKAARLWANTEIRFIPPLEDFFFRVPRLLPADETLLDLRFRKFLCGAWKSTFWLFFSAPSSSSTLPSREWKSSAPSGEMFHNETERNVSILFVRIFRLCHVVVVGTRTSSASILGHFAGMWTRTWEICTNSTAFEVYRQHWKSSENISTRK